MILNDLDLGPSHPWMAPQQGQVLGSAFIEGTRTIVWPRGAQTIRHDIKVWVTAWQAIGGQAANTFGAVRYLVKQLEELASNPDLQPVYIQWTNSAASGAFTRADEHDGWYVIENVQPDYSKVILSGSIECRMTVTQVAPATPSSLAAWYSGAALASTYSQAAQPTIGFPIGSSFLTNGWGSRTGAEGAVPIAGPPLAGTINPVTFVRPAGLYTGQCRVYDTLNTSSNPVPIAGAFVHANWVEVKGTQHDFVGDCVVTNGLLLLLFQPGVAGIFTPYLWNTSLGTPAWQSQGTVSYSDNTPNSGTLREVNLEMVGLEEVRVRLVTATSGAQWAMHKLRLQRGMYHAPIEFWPLTQANTGNYGLSWTPANAQKIIYSNAGAGCVDVVTSPGTTMASSGVSGHAGAFGTTANGPIAGFLYQNAPASQPWPSTSTFIGLGDSSGPAQNSFRLYAFFAVPFVTAPNLQAEGESGTLGTGWTSIADAAGSAGNTAKCASGTLSGNADLFGTSWIPSGGKYDCWFRVRVTSAAGGTGEMTLGLWDVTSAAFVASTTYAANAASTSYVWLRAATAVTPTATHNMRFRAVTAATLGTDWFIDEAALVPRESATIGQGNFPGDIFSQFLFDRTVRWARG